MSWDSKKSADLYGINYWSGGYFYINKDGSVEVTPRGKDGLKLDLHALTKDLYDRGIRPPILIRLPDIVKSRIELLAECFHKAIDDCGYKSSYCGVYPIKVNQQSHLVEEIIEFGKFNRLGLECGSKPELLVALSLMDTPNALIICNGFKDQEYIETALLSQKLSRKTYLVVDRFAELEMIIAASKKLSIKANIGFRAKLNSQGSGKWTGSSGARSKFGLSPSEIVSGIKILKEADMLSSLDLIHFHIGSQITSIQNIKTSIKEAARFYAECHLLGASPKYLDVGGGLGIDYDASGGKSDSSTNYNEQEYVNDVVSIIQSICDEKNVPHPHIITESGRSLVAHSSVLVFDVLGSNVVAKTDLNIEVDKSDSGIVHELFEIYNTLNSENINEFYNDLLEKKRDTMNMFSYGVLDLNQRAKAEDIAWAITTKMAKLAKKNDDSESIYWKLERELSDTYFCNFSIFQSLPDSWALKQTFPVMPIHRLDEKPSRKATLADLTCDSDGKIDEFIDIEEESTQRFLEVHELKKDEHYFMGVFLTGAYQETLGDLHNLFGDANAVHVSITEDGYNIDHVVEGDSVEEVLNYVEYSKPKLIEKIRKASEVSISSGNLSKQEAKLLMKYYQQSLAGYTYLEDPDEH